jgi:hypothetical protein
VKRWMVRAIALLGVIGLAQLIRRYRLSKRKIIDFTWHFGGFDDTPVCGAELGPGHMETQFGKIVNCPACLTWLENQGIKEPADA